MNPLARIKTFFTGSSKSIDLSGTDLVGWQGVGGSATLRHYKENQYENGYASISKIANQFLTIRPYAIDAKGDRVAEVGAVDALYHPNKSMSATDFREALAVMLLVHPEVNILVWTNQNGVATPGGDITPDNIAGYHILEDAVKTYLDGKVTYRVGHNIYTDAEVLAIRTINPYDLNSGFSASQAAARWTRLDDYIADYQRGFFENGAVPAGMFKVTARTATEYKDIVRKMQDKHRGAGKNNNVTYTHAPIDPSSGKAEAAGIEWVPFNTTNKDMALKDIFAQVNQKIDSTYGVPASIRGVNDNNTYASVRIDEQIFIKYVVNPFATKLYSKLTHELNRVTGGIGAAITFDIDIPGVADEDKTAAEAKQVEAGVISSMTAAGFSLDSIIEAFSFGERYRKLAASPVVTPNVDREDNPDIDEGDETVDAPDPEQLDKSVHTHTSKVLTDEQRSIYESRVAVVASRFMERQIEDAVADVSKAVGDPSKDDMNLFISEMLSTTVPIMIMEGSMQYAEGTRLLLSAGLDPNNLTSYYVSPEQLSRYRTYLESVGTSYATETAQSIRAVLERSTEQGLTSNQMTKQLRDIIKNENWRVKRIAVTETNRAGSQASIYAMEQIEAETNTNIVKIWNTSSTDTCPYCMALNGKQIPVTSTFAAEGDEIVGTDGSVMVNNFVSMEVTSAHPNCQCYATYKVIR